MSGTFVVASAKRDPIEDTYSLKSQLGRCQSFYNPIFSGNFSTVREGIHKKTGEKFAVKVVDKDRCEEKELQGEVWRGVLE